MDAAQVLAPPEVRVGLLIFYFLQPIHPPVVVAAICLSDPASSRYLQRVVWSLTMEFFFVTAAPQLLTSLPVTKGERRDSRDSVISDELVSILLC